MPARKKPSTLQSFALRRIGGLFKTTVQVVTEEINNVLDHEIHMSFAHWKSFRASLLCEPVAQIQKCLFMDTAYYFHEQILIECLVSFTLYHISNFNFIIVCTYILALLL